MLSRFSRSAAGLLSCQLIPKSRERSLWSTYRQLDAFVRFHRTVVGADGIENRETRLRRFRPKIRVKRKGEKVTLDVNALGKPGEIVVVPQRKRRRRSKLEKAPKGAEEGAEEDVEEGSGENVQQRTLPFILRELEEETTSINHIAPNEAIEKFRFGRRPGDKLSLADWEDIRSKIQSSFTVQQLSDYIHKFAQAKSLAADQEPSQRRLNSAAWKPGTSMYLETDPAAQGRVTNRIAQDLRGKQLLAERILRDCWQLGVMDEIGQLDIRLPSHLITLLTNSEHFSLEDIANLHEASIDVDHSLELVRVTGSQHVCESISEIIHDATARVREEDVASYGNAAKDGKGRIFTAEFRDWISKTYRVVLQQKPRSGLSKIYYLAEDKQEADQVRRTLDLAIYNSKTSSYTPFCTYLPSSEKAIVYNVNPENNVSWLERNRPWFRWAMPSARITEVDALSTPFFDKHHPGLSDELLKLLRRGFPGTETGETITAAIGRCLFSGEMLVEEGKTVSASQLGESSLPRTFTTDIPGTTSFLSLLTSFPSGNNHHSYRIRLIPSATNPKLPPLELEIAMKRTDPLSAISADFSVRSVRAILDENSVDYLLPEIGLDIRFTRSLHRDLLTGPDDSPSIFQDHVPLLASIRSMLQQVFPTHSLGVGQQSLPIFCHISIPKGLLRGVLDFEGVVVPESGSADEIVVGEYVFPPLNDILGSRVHHYDFLGERLNYSFYESGPFLPYRKTDIALDMDVTRSITIQSGGSADASASGSEGDSTSGALQREFNSFYKTACKLAFEVDRVRLRE